MFFALQFNILDPDILGTWVAAILTLCIFSFLYKDNPFYKFAEHLFVGVSAGYTFVVTFWNFVYPNLIVPLFLGNEDGSRQWSLIIPTILGIMMVMHLIPQFSWMSRWPIAFFMGAGAGLNFVFVLQASGIIQIQKTIEPFSLAKTPMDWVNASLMAIGVLTGLMYFFFSAHHKGFMGIGAKIGIYFLMVSFGAAFGYTIMARISLLIGRIYFLMFEWLQLTPY